MIPECANEGGLFFLCLLLEYLSYVCFVLFNSAVLIFIFILCYTYSLEISFPMKEKGGGSRWEELGRVEGAETVVRVYYVR